MTPKPAGLLTYHHSETKQTNHALYIDVFYRDEDGVFWKLHTSVFLFQLEIVE